MQYRKEEKYIISRAEFLRIEKKIGLFMQQDENTTDGIYIVRSLYFDTAENYDLQSSLSGLMKKSKVRLRLYPPNMDSIKLELKEKEGYDGLKISVSITRDQAEDLLKMQYRFLLDYKTKEAQKIYFHLASNAYMPKSIVEYKRYVYKHPVSNTRITFDYDAVS